MYFYTDMTHFTLTQPCVTQLCVTQTCVIKILCITLHSKSYYICIMNKPFAFGVAVGNEHFIGRKMEIEHLSNNFRYGVNTILMAPRRMGKTSLVKRVAKEVESADIKIVHLDAFACRSEYDFLNSFAAAVLKQTSSHLEEWKNTVQEFLVRLTPRISISPEPNADFAVSLGITPKTHTPEEILDLPERIAKRKGYHIIICIDEFQQVGEFPDSLSVQKRMRTVWQHQENVSYCLYGSKKNMMNTLFLQRSKPFYKFGTTMNLGVIPAEEWIPFLCQRFTSIGKELPEHVAEAICQKVELHSSYVQELAFNTLICMEGNRAAIESVDEAFENMLDENTPLFQEKTERLTTYQLNFLRAIIDGVHKDFGMANIREDYNLGSSANIVRLKNALIERELISILPDGIFIADPVLHAWIKQRMSK